MQFIIVCFFFLNLDHLGVGHGLSTIKLLIIVLVLLVSEILLICGLMVCVITVR